MIETIQPRHVKLWVAARNGDWAFAAYELGNLKGAFDRLGRAYPVEHNIPLQDLISGLTAPAFEDLHKAIQSKDADSVRQGLRRSHLHLQRLPSGYRPWRGRHSGSDELINLRPGLCAGGASVIAFVSLSCG